MSEPVEITSVGMDFLENFPGVPRYSHITENLWMGGCPQSVCPEEFDYIFNLYPWGRYKLHSHQEQHCHSMWDNDQYVVDRRLIHYIADTVNTCCKMGPTLVHCHQGINRSGLVVAAALILRGWEPLQVIEHIRKCRSPEVLYRKSFRKWLMEECPKLRTPLIIA